MAEAPFTVSNRFLRLLAYHLFGDSPAVALRELVQNAHDAVLMRAATDAGPKDGWGVRITLDEPQRQITLLDTGVGMTAKDIVDSLTCLGVGGKGQDKLEELRRTVKNPEMLRNVAGYFGFGFIAAMMVSKKVEIWTHAADAPPVYCRFDEGEGAGFYEEQETQETPDMGTRVLLHVDAERAVIDDDLIPAARKGTLLHLETVERILTKYCDLVEFEIMLSSVGETTPHVVNQRQAPWERGPRPSAKEMLSYFSRRFGEGLNQPIDYAVFKLTPETHNIEASGVLYVPRPGRREQEKLEIFVKRIWVCDDDLSLLPEWARFLRGVIVSPDLAVTLSRRGLDKLDKSYHNLSIALRDYLRSYLVELAGKRPQTLRELLDVHGDALRRGLLEARFRFEGSRPAWYADLVRNVPFRVYSRQYPGGYEASVNDLLGLEPSAPFAVKPDGERHQLHGVNRVVPPDQQSEFRKVIADKSGPIIVPENDLDLVCLQAVGQEFKEVLQIEDIEFRFGTTFVEPLPAAERDRWQRFVQFVSSEMLRYEERKGTGEVTAGGIPKTELPMLIHWRERKGAGQEDEEKQEEQEETQDQRSHFQQITTINTANPFMQDLLNYVDEREIRRIDLNSLVGNCLFVSYYLALIEQDAALQSDTFQHIAQQTMALMKRSLAGERELLSAKTVRDELQGEFGKLQKEIERLRSAPKPDEADRRVRVPEKPQRRTAAIVIVDLVKSTQAMLGMDFADRGEVFARYADVLKAEIEKKDGFFDKFTGDGVMALFGVDKEEANITEACTKALGFADLAKLLTKEFGDRDDVRQKLHDLTPGRSGVGAFSCRIAISCGSVAFGEFGGLGSAVGTKVVEAARICSDAELYGGEDKHGIIVTGDVHAAMQAPRGLELLTEGYEPNGLEHHPIELYRVV